MNRLIRRLGIALAFLIAMGLVAPQANAASVQYTKAERAYGYTFTKTANYPLGGFSGTHKIPNPSNTADVRPGYCVDPLLSTAYADYFYTTTAAIPNNIYASSNPRIRWLQNSYGLTTSKATARQVFWAIRILQNSKYKTDVSQLKNRGSISTDDYNKIYQYAGLSKIAGDVKVTVHSPLNSEGKTTMPGETGKGKIVFTNATTGAYLHAGNPVTVSVSGNGTLTSVNGVAGAKTGKVGSSGTVTYTVKHNGEGAFTVSSSVVVASSKRVVITKRMNTKQQRLMVGRLTETYKGYKTHQRKLGGLSMTAECSLNCDGTAKVTLKVCNTNTVSYAKFPVKDANGTVLFNVDVAPSDCTPTVFDAEDADVFVINSYCYESGPRGPCLPGGYVAIPETRFEVVCPAWIQVAITLGCSCLDAWGNVALNNQVTPRHNVATIEVAQPGLPVVSTQYPLASGQKMIVPLKDKVAPGTVITVSWTSYMSSSNLTVIPGFNNKTMEAVQLVFGGGSSKAQLDANTDVKVLTDTVTGSVKVG
jgi:hypothetical protein